jgi:hypothetical protein
MRAVLLGYVGAALRYMQQSMHVWHEVFRLQVCLVQATSKGKKHARMVRCHVAVAAAEVTCRHHVYAYSCSYSCL